MSWAILLLATVTASVLQTVTGFGFGLLCIPVFLWVIDSAAAIHLVTIITLLVSLAIWPLVRSRILPGLLFIFGLGCVFGSPLGVTLFNRMDMDRVKLAAAVVILTVTLWNAYVWLKPAPSGIQTGRHRTNRHKSVQFGIGVTSGILGASLAMPAPPVMLYLSGGCWDKEQIRSTVLVFSVLAYAVALVCQMATQGVDRQTWQSAALLAPAALAGVYIGHRLAARVNKVYFRIIVFITLILTGLTMLINAVI